MNKKIPVSDFISSLNAECDALKSLITLLESEQASLISGNTDQLLALSDSKIQAVQKINTLANSRKNYLGFYSDEIKAKGLIVWLQTHATVALPIWKNIQQLADKMQSLNRTNGTLIQTKLRHNQQALAILLNTTNSTHGLYGADGQPNSPSSSRILGSV